MMNAPQVGVVMGSSSDWEVMKHAAMLLKQLGIHFERWCPPTHAGSAVRIRLHRGGTRLKAIIAGAGGAAHLPGMIASRPSCRCSACRCRRNTSRASIRCCHRADAEGHPVATFAIGEAGAANAALFAAALIARYDSGLAAQLDGFRRGQSDSVIAMELPDVE
jgi:5-(carboxyamino)imidazole ribonucleotide mutase